MAETPLSDEALIKLLQEGNSRYFATLTNRYTPYIQQRCRAYVRDEEQAADLSQEILIKVFLQLPKFRGEAKFSTWLYTIIHHACVDFLRREKHNPHEAITEKLADEIGELLEIDEEPDEEITMEVLEALLEELTPEDKLILLLKYREKHALRDIQATLGLQESAVKMRIKRARERLHKLYQARKNRARG